MEYSHRGVTSHLGVVCAPFSAREGIGAHPPRIRLQLARATPKCSEVCPANSCCSCHDSLLSAAVCSPRAVKASREVSHESRNAAKKLRSIVVPPARVHLDV